MSLFYKPGELPYDHNDGPEVEAAKAAWWRKGGQVCSNEQEDSFCRRRCRGRYIPITDFAVKWGIPLDSVDTVAEAQMSDLCLKESLRAKRSMREALPEYEDALSRLEDTNFPLAGSIIMGVLCQDEPCEGTGWPYCPAEGALTSMGSTRWRQDEYHSGDTSYHVGYHFKVLGMDIVNGTEDLERQRRIKKAHDEVMSRWNPSWILHETPALARTRQSRTLRSPPHSSASAPVPESAGNVNPVNLTSYPRPDSSAYNTNPSQFVQSTNPGSYDMYQQQPSGPSGSQPPSSNPWTRQPPPSYYRQDPQYPPRH